MEDSKGWSATSKPWIDTADAAATANPRENRQAKICDKDFCIDSSQRGDFDPPNGTNYVPAPGGDGGVKPGPDN